MATVKEIIRNDAVRLFPDKLLETEENVDDAMILAKMHCEAAAEGHILSSNPPIHHAWMGGFVKGCSSSEIDYLEE